MEKLAARAVELMAAKERLAPDWYKPCTGGTFTDCEIMAKFYAAARKAQVSLPPEYGAIDWSKVDWVYGIPSTTGPEKLAEERTAFRIKEGLEVPTVVTDEDCLAIGGHMDRLRG